MTQTKARKKAAPAAAKATNLDEMPDISEEPSTNGHGPKVAPGQKGYDWQQDYPGEQVFVYTTPSGQKSNSGNPIGGQTIGLAAISDKRQPSVGFLRKVRHKPEFDQVVDMIEMVAGENALALMDEWNPSDLQDMFDEWSQWQNTTAGKS